MTFAIWLQCFLRFDIKSYAVSFSVQVTFMKFNIFISLFSCIGYLEYSRTNNVETHTI